MKQRVRTLQAVFLLCFLAVFVKLFYWQVIDRKRLKTLAAQQYYTSGEFPASRGKMFTSDNFPLVLNTPAYLLFANPQQLEISPFVLAEKLQDFINLENLDFEGLANKELLWLPLAKKLNEENKKSIEELKIKGLGFEEEEARFYPEASMSAHLLGFVGEDDLGRPKGYFGLEGYYDNEIRGKPGGRFYEKDALGQPIPLSEGVEEKAIAGRNLFLNLDRAVQFVAEKKLQEALEKYGSPSGSVLVMDPQNGAVLAMASLPAYNPAFYYLYESDFYRNPVISSAFEPGSIFKPLVMAAAIETKAVALGERCPKCSGPRQIYDCSIETWNEQYYPDSTMTEILVHSDNVGMVYVAEKLGADRFYEYLRKFGFGEKTDIDLQGEIIPILREKGGWREIDLATASFGQGIAVTPIQLLTAICAIANGGELYQPQVVRKIFEDQHSITVEPQRKKRPLSSKTAEVVTQMMVKAVEKGEAKWVKPAGYKIAGKTGTAQIPIAGHYDPEKTIASFVGFAPAEDPRFAMLVTLREPQTSSWGSETAAPLWFEIAQEIFRLWQIAPEN